jgi:uncharacterized membrane protein
MVLPKLGARTFPFFFLAVIAASLLLPLGIVSDIVANLPGPPSTSRTASEVLLFLFPVVFAMAVYCSWSMLLMKGILAEQAEKLAPKPMAARTTVDVPLRTGSKGWQKRTGLERAVAK